MFSIRETEILSKQTLASGIVCLALVSYGASMAYPNILFGQNLIQTMEFSFENSKHLNKSEPIKSSNKIIFSLTQETFITSFYPIGSIIGCLFTIFLEPWFGNRLTLMLMSTADVIGWIVIAVSWTPSSFMVGRLFCGISSGSYPSTVASYIAEVSTPKCRGILLQITIIAICLGIVLVFLAGTFLNWSITAFFCSSISILLMIGLCFLPDSPYVCIQIKRNNERAGRALAWLRSSTINDTKEELNNMIKHLATFRKGDAGKASFLTSIKMLFHDPTCYKPFISLIILFLFQFMSGNHAVTAYSASIYQQAGIQIRPEYANVISSAFKFVIAVCSLPLVMIFQRKRLLCLSCGLCALSIYGLAFYFMYVEAWQLMTWIPVILISLFMASFSIAFQVIPNCYIGELYPRNVCQHYGNLTALFSFSFYFVTLYLHPFMDEFLPPGYPYWIYGTICVMSIFYVVIFIPETKGLTLAQIHAFYKSKSIPEVDMENVA